MMKNLFIIIVILLFCVTASGESSLPKCEGTNFTRWTNCFGNEKLKNGSYVGEYKNGNFHGKGILQFDNGEKYEGQFVKGKRDGYGNVIFPDGTQYTGQFKNNNRN